MSLTDMQRAYALIKERIITTQMPPGSLIQELALMKEFGIGRTPIREALKQLEMEKLVVISPRRGMFVAEVTLTNLAQIQEIRDVIDSLAVRLAVQRATPHEIEALRCLLDETGEAELLDARQTMTFDRRIHELLARATHNELLAAELERYYGYSLRIWYLYLSQLGPTDLAMDAFREVLAGIETGDAARAEAAMRWHIQDFGEAIKRHL